MDSDEEEEEADVSSAVHVYCTRDCTASRLVDALSAVAAALFHRICCSFEQPASRGVVGKVASEVLLKNTAAASRTVLLHCRHPAADFSDLLLLLLLLLQGGGL